MLKTVQKPITETLQRVGTKHVERASSVSHMLPVTAATMEWLTYYRPLPLYTGLRIIASRQWTLAHNGDVVGFPAALAWPTVFTQSTIAQLVADGVVRRIFARKHCITYHCVNTSIADRR